MLTAIKNFFLDIKERIASEMKLRKRMKTLRQKDPFIYK
jgi:hypothetical protein